jgi:hypothetical protein
MTVAIGAHEMHGWISAGHARLREALTRMTARRLAMLCEDTEPMRRHRAYRVGRAGADSTAKAIGALRRGQSRYPAAPLMVALQVALGIETAAWFRSIQDESKTACRGL